ncbi:hypothetical protein [Psychromicrobium xiongbiense]|uniref:COG4705 family protein n=1 Tax=Psychromicrobium xiongbiense TaxID=3051184 RepID=UPI002556D9AF|nr:hypothetical protein [Psychromicrobium sp. YIM S02556]
MVLTENPTRRLLTGASKVPEVTAAFWVIKVLTTGMGETASDYLTHQLIPELAVALGAAGFVLALVLQLAVRRYIPWIYWATVVMVSVFGTMCADVLHVGLGVPYTASTLGFLVVLAAVFLLWRRSEGTLSIHSIVTRRREIFYWMVVVTTFALGTAAGDLTAMTLNLGHLGSGLIFAVVIAIPALAFWKFRLNAVAAFWFAYIVTRPLGASLADWMAVPEGRGGLNWGAGPVTVGLTTLIVVAVGLLSLRQSRHSSLRGQHLG